MLALLIAATEEVTVAEALEGDREKKDEDVEVGGGGCAFPRGVIGKDNESGAGATCCCCCNKAGETLMRFSLAL